MDQGSVAPQTLQAWALVRTMLDDMTAMVQADAENETELIEGLQVVSRAAALCVELSIDADPSVPDFIEMNTPSRHIGGPVPDGRYLIAMLDGTRGYRIAGNRGSSAYLGFQVLAGIGLTPRRMATYVSDSDLELDADGSFSLVFAADEPSAAALGGGQWVRIPEDSSAVVVREYVSDPTTERLAELDIELIGPAPLPEPISDEAAAERFTSLAWTIAKLTTLHRTIKPELLEQPNELVSALGAELGAADTTPDNLYMIGTFRLGDGETLQLEIDPPETRFWSVTLENIWHECIDPRRHRSSATGATLTPDADGIVRVSIAAQDPGAGHWLDTGGRHRGFVLLRWLDHPEPPSVTVNVLGGSAGA